MKTPRSFFEKEIRNVLKMPNKPKKEKVSRRVHDFVVFSISVKLTVFWP